MEASTSAIASQFPTRALCGIASRSSPSMRGRGASSKTISASATEKWRMLMSNRFSRQAATKTTRETHTLRHCSSMPLGIADCAGERRFTSKAVAMARRSSRRNANCDFKRKSAGK